MLGSRNKMLLHEVSSHTWNKVWDLQTAVKLVMLLNKKLKLKSVCKIHIFSDIKLTCIQSGKDITDVGSFIVLQTFLRWTAMS